MLKVLHIVRSLSIHPWVRKFNLLSFFPVYVPFLQSLRKNMCLYCSVESLYRQKKTEIGRKSDAGTPKAKKFRSSDRTAEPENRYCQLKSLLHELGDFLSEVILTFLNAFALLKAGVAHELD